jgi:D-glycero-alpha-D-manno-heptose-7-phosphate kinase
MKTTAQAPVRIDLGGAWTDVDLYAHAHGGAVFNATINHYATGTLSTGHGVQVSYTLDLPTGSGLGTSAALNVAYLALLSPHSTREEIAERAYRFEAEILGYRGGKQDQWASALGGFNLLRFASDGVTSEKITLPGETLATLQARSVLVYTGKPRLSAGIHGSVWRAYEAGNSVTVEALHTLKSLALQMPDVLKSGDIDGFARLVAENWKCQKALDDSVTNPQIDELFARARSAGAIGGKACGAGGGGCLYFVSAKNQRDKLLEALTDAGAREIAFHFEFDGLCTSSSHNDYIAPEDRKV